MAKAARSGGHFRYGFGYGSGSSRGTRAAFHRRRRLSLEGLETRALLTVTYTVVNTNDTAANTPGYNGSLRWAIDQINADANPAGEEIAFNIAGSGVHTISPTSPLPAVTSPVTIDGWSQPGFSGSPLVELNGSQAGNPYTGRGGSLYGAEGLILSGGNSLVRGLVVNDFSAFGIYLDVTSAGQDSVQGCYTGTNPTGTISEPNASDGVFVFGSHGFNLIGTNGDGVNDLAERNIIADGVGIEGSGSTAPTDPNAIAGNYIGTDVTGTMSLVPPTGSGVGIVKWQNCRIGTNGTDPDAAAEGNLISGNTNGAGVDVEQGSNNAVVAGNLIGTDVTGRVALPNRYGVEILYSTDNCLIGTNGDGIGDTYERNVISGNSSAGIILGDGPAQCHVAGNYIGTDVSGTVALGDGQETIRSFSSNGNVIGTDGTGITADERNIIEGRVRLDDSNNIVAGNYLGTDVTGTQALADSYVFIPDTGGNNQIGSDAAGDNAAAMRNVIVGEAGVAIGSPSAGSNVIASNCIGTNAAGTQTLGTPYWGIHLQDTAGNDLISDNVIAGMSNAAIFSEAGSNDVMTSNKIGTDASGSKVLGNANYGISLAGTAANAQIAGNVITGSGNDAVALTTAAQVGISIRGNQIFSNGFGIDLGGSRTPVLNDSQGHVGANNYQNFPVITSVVDGSSTTVTGTFDEAAEPSAHITLDFYRNPTADPTGYGQGQTYLGSYTVTTDSNGHASFTTSFATPSGGENVVTATATDTAGNTSEFSRDAIVPALPTTTAVNSSPNPSVNGQTVTFTATLAAVTGTPTGSVTFVDQTTGQNLGTAPLAVVNNVDQASLTVSSLVVGAQTITATYTSDNNYLTTSGSIAQVVNSSASTVLVTSNRDDGSAGTLRWAIANAAAGNTIEFQSGITQINLTQGQIEIGKSLTIAGPGASDLAIDQTTGGAALLQIDATDAASISGVSLGGSITDNGSLSYSDWGNITIAGAISGSGMLSIATPGAINQGAPITAATLIANAATGIALGNANNAINNFTATNSTSGGVSLINAASLTIGGIMQESEGGITVANTGSVTVAGAISSSGRGAVTLTAAGTDVPMNVSANVSGPDGLTLYATGSLNIGAGITVNSYASLLTLGADVTPSGTGDNGVGTLSVGGGANIYGGSITLRGAHETIAPTATVGNAAATVTAFPTSGIGGIFTAPFALDGNGHLYAANANSISEFDTSTGSLVSTISGNEFNGINALTYGEGDLYVANYSGTDSNIVVIDASTGQLVSTITSSGSSFISALLYQAGNLYVASFDDHVPASDSDTIDVIDASSGQLIKTINSTEFNGPQGLAIDQAGNLYVGNNNGTIAEVTPEGGVSIFASGFFEPSAIAFDDAGNLWVSDVGSGGIIEVTPSGTTALGGFNNPALGGFNFGVAIDAAGNLYTTDGNSLYKVAPPLAPTFQINLQSSIESNPINIGGTTLAPQGVSLTDAELAQLDLAQGGTLQIGDSGQSGPIAVTFGNLPAVFDTGTANVVGNGNVNLDVYATNNNDSITKTSGGSAVTWSEGSETFNVSGIDQSTLHLGTGNQTVYDPGSTTILGGPGHDTIFITATAGNGVTINSGTGSDDVTVDLGAIAAPVTIVQPSSTSTNTLTIVAPPTSSSIGVTSSQLTSGSQTINYPSTISSVTVAAGTANTSVNVASTSAAGVTVQNQGGTTSAAVTLGNLAGPVNVTGTGTTSVAVSAPTGNNTIAVSGSGVQSGSQMVNVNTTVTSLAVDTGSGTNSVSVSNLGSTVQNLAVNSGSGTTSVTLNNVGSSAPPITVSGGSGTTQVQVVGTPPPQLAYTTTTAVTTDHPNGSLYGQNLTFTATVSTNVTGATSTGTVQFVIDGKNVGPAETLTGGAASLTISSLLAGPHTVAAQFTSNSASFLNSASNPSFTASVGVANSIYVLNPTASGALSISGNASIKLPGGSDLFVDSNATGAIQASGNATVTASGVLVVGGINKSGQAHVAATGTPAATGDPFAALPSASTAGLTNFGSLNVSGNTSKTINPGIYSQISVSGNATLTMNAGTYLIEGGGMTVSGNASVTGSGVFIFNAGSGYSYNTTTGVATDGGNFGGITLSGNGKFNLSGPTSGMYAGIVIDQARDNTRALSLGGNATSGITSTIYAANALLTVSGNAQLSGSIVVGTLNASGNVALTQMAAGSDGSGDVASIADTLLAGNLYVYVDNSNGGFSPDELARINDAINTWNTLLVPYSVNVTEVSDPALANLVIDTGTTSASGDAADGVLGCYNSAANEVTLLQGWNWYAGADASQIGADQYDFQTTVTHEIGHALGLGGGSDPNSPMYESLAVGVAHRLPNVADLNIPEPPEGADPQMAAGYVDGDSVRTSTALTPAPSQGEREIGPAASSLTIQASQHVDGLAERDLLFGLMGAATDRQELRSDTGSANGSLRSEFTGAAIAMTRSELTMWRNTLAQPFDVQSEPSEPGDDPIAAVFVTKALPPASETAETSRSLRADSADGVGASDRDAFFTKAFGPTNDIEGHESTSAPNASTADHGILIGLGAAFLGAGITGWDKRARERRPTITRWREGTR